MDRTTAIIATGHLTLWFEAPTVMWAANFEVRGRGDVAICAYRVVELLPHARRQGCLRQLWDIAKTWELRLRLMDSPSSVKRSLTGLSRPPASSLPRSISIIRSCCAR